MRSWKLKFSDAGFCKWYDSLISYFISIYLLGTSLPQLYKSINVSKVSDNILQSLWAIYILFRMAQLPSILDAFLKKTFLKYTFKGHLVLYPYICFIRGMFLLAISLYAGIIWCSLSFKHHFYIRRTWTSTFYLHELSEQIFHCFKNSSSHIYHIFSRPRWYFFNPLECLLA